MEGQEEEHGEAERWPAWALAAGILLPMLFFGAILFSVTLTGSWGVGHDEQSADALRYREHFALIFCFGSALLVALPLELLLLRDRHASLARWAVTGFLGGAIVAGCFLAYMIHHVLDPKLTFAGVRSLLWASPPPNIFPAFLIFGFAGAMMAVIARAVTRLLTHLTRRP